PAGRVDRFGDPLPPGVVARLGAIRWHEPQDVGRLAYSPDGRYLASGSDRLATHDRVAVREAATGRVLWRALTDPGPGLHFSPDSRTLLTAWHDGGVCGVTLHDVATGRILRRLTGHPAPVRAAAFTPDGRTLLTAGERGEVLTWRPDRGKPHGRWQAPLAGE